MKRWEQQETIRSLRREGLSYREILAKVPFALSRSTMSHWCRDIELTPTQLDRLDGVRQTSWYRNRLLGAKTTQRRRAEEVAAIEAMARAEVAQRLHDPFWLAGTMLYWAEGSKTWNVAFTDRKSHV